MPAATVPQALALAAEHREARRFAEAEGIYLRMLREWPEHPDVLHELALLHQAAGQPGAACAALERALARRRGDPALLNTLSIVLRSAGRHCEAIAASREALLLRRDEPILHCNLGLALQTHGQQEAAHAAYREALALRPDFTPAHTQLGILLSEQRRYPEAAAAFEKACESSPGDPAHWTNLAVAHEKLGEFAQARALYEKALALHPHFAPALKNYTFSLLRGGDFARGWELYERRFDAPDFPTPLRDLRTPWWDGSDPRGRTILLHHEQGYGDNIQFARYAGVLAEMGATVLLECLAPLRELFASLPGVARLLAPDEPPPPHEVRCHLMSLPHRLKTIPVAVPYLTAPLRKLEEWRARLGAGDGWRVGLAWAGNPSHANDRDRSCPLAVFAPLAALPGVRLFSLQKESTLPCGFPLHDFSAHLETFADTAALIANLDLTISVDTAAAHLAGALGRPVWMLASAVPEWRWMLGREDSPWYPTLRIFRQPRLGDWESVIGELVGMLASANRTP